MPVRKHISFQILSVLPFDKNPVKYTKNVNYSCIFKLHEGTYGKLAVYYSNEDSIRVARMSCVSWAYEGPFNVLY